MKKWNVTTYVEAAHGCQVWQVEAKTAEEAERLVESGEGDCVAEEIEVTSISKPDPVLTYEVTESEEA